MIEFLTDASGVLLRTTLALAVTAVVAAVLLRLLRSQSYRAHRIAWVCVLVQGVLIAQWSFEVPWLTPVEHPPQDSAGAFEDLPDIMAIENGDERQQTTLAIVGPDVRQEFAWSWNHLFAALWLAGVVATLGATASGYVLLLISLRRARPAQDRWQGEWQTLQSGQGVHREIPLLVHPTLGPMLCRLPGGYAVVVPELLWSQFTAGQRTAILRHELAHYQRGDVWTSLVARLSVVPHWFNPLAWWAVRKFEEGGEWACDQQLAESDPRQVPVFARALLAIVEPDANQAFASAARGASVSVRLRRLLSFQSQEDSLMKRCLVFGVLLCMLAVGLFRIQLVARESEDDERPAASVAFEREAIDFAGRIHAGTDQLKQFQAALDTPAGQIVLQDRASYFAERLREEAETEALPQYFEKNFEKDGETYHLRSGDEAFREDLVTSAAGFNSDVEKIRSVLQDLGKQISGDSETDRLVARFLQHEAASVMLYVHELRERLRPDARVVADRMGELFVANEEGRYILRPGRRIEAEQHLNSGLQASRVLATIHAEMKVLSEEFSERDELNKRAKKHLAEPMFAAYIAAHFFGEGDEDAARQVDEFFEGFSHIAVDTADGLAIVEAEPREEIQQEMDEFERLVAVAPKLARPLKAFAAKIDPSEPLASDWQELLNSDVAVLKIAQEFEFADANPEQAARQLLNEILEEGDGGELKVRSNNQEEITEFVRDMFRSYREVRRRGRAIERFAEQLDDEPLREAFSSTGGKYIVLHAIQRSFANRSFSGLSTWIDEVFEAGDEGLVLREGGDEEIEGFLVDVRDVNEELKKDDF